MSDILLSLLAIYNQDPEILDAQHLILPEDVNRNTLLPILLSETAELEIVYPDPDILKVVIKAWSTARNPSWEKMIEALTAEYNPIHNYDRTEEEENNLSTTESVSDRTAEDVEDQIRDNTTETIDDSSEDTVSGRNTQTTDETVSDTSSETKTVDTEEDIADSSSGSNSTTTIEQVTGFNSSTFADNKKVSASGTTTGTSSRDRDVTETTSTTGSLDRDRDVTTTDVKSENIERTRDATITDTRQGSNVRDRDVAFDRDREEGREGSRNLHVYGNIGVLTTQKMIEEELQLRMKDMYRTITDEFTRYFCLMVY